MRAEGQGDRRKGRKPGQHGAAREALGRAGSCGRVWGHTGGQARGPEIAVAPEGVGDGQRWTLERPSLSVQPLPFRPPAHSHGPVPRATDTAPHVRLGTPRPSPGPALPPQATRRPRTGLTRPATCDPVGAPGPGWEAGSWPPGQ